MELERDRKETTSMSRRTFFTGLGAAGIGLIAGSTLTGMGNAAAGQSVTDSVYGNNGDPPLGCCIEYNVMDKGVPIAARWRLLMRMKTDFCGSAAWTSTLCCSR